jgi:hypothetical protein
VLYPLARVPVLAAKADPVFPQAQALDAIMKAASATRPAWSVIPDLSKDGDPCSRKLRYFETLCTQFESLLKRYNTAQAYFSIDDQGSNDTAKTWTEEVGKMQDQVYNEGDQLLLDLQCQTLSKYLLGVAKTVSALEEDVMRDNFEANKSLARLAAMNLAG